MSTPFARFPLIDSRFRCGTCHLQHCNASIRILVDPSEGPAPPHPLYSPSSSVYRPLLAATKWVNLSTLAAHTERPIVTAFGNSFVAEWQQEHSQKLFLTLLWSPLYGSLCSIFYPLKHYTTKLILYYKI